MPPPAARARMDLDGTNHRRQLRIDTDQLTEFTQQDSGRYTSLDSSSETFSQVANKSQIRTPSSLIPSEFPSHTACCVEILEAEQGRVVRSVDECRNSEIVCILVRSAENERKHKDNAEIDEFALSL